jgi:PAS domain S-box-containing protein
MIKGNSHKDVASLSMAGPSKRSDEDSSSSISTESILFISKRDILPITFIGVFIFIGLAICLISYYTVKIKDDFALQQQLDKDAGLTAFKIQQGLDSVKSNLGSVGTYLTAITNVTGIDYQKQWIGFVYDEDNKFFPYMLRLDYCSYQPKKTIQALITQTRARGGMYANYTDYGLDSNNNKVPQNLTTSSLYLPVLFTAPIGNEQWLGYDYYSNLLLRTEIVRGGKIKHSTVYTVQLNDTGGYMYHIIGFQVFDFFTGAIIGAAYAKVDLLSIVKDVVSTELMGAGVSFSLFNINITNPTNYTYGVWQYSTLEGATEQSVKDHIASSEFVSSNSIVYLSDAYFRLVITSSKDYVAQNTSFDRYIAVIVTCVGTIVLIIGCIVVIFVNRVVLSLQARAKGMRRLEALRANHDNMSILLGRLAQQEAKTRACLNCIPEFLAMISDNGKIMHTNQYFDEVFGYSEQKLEMGITITWLFPKLDLLFYRLADSQHDRDTTKWREAIAMSSEEKEITVLFTVKSLESAQLRSDVMSEVNKHQDVNQEDREAYVVIGRLANGN